MKNPWADLPIESPFVLDCDKEIVCAFNKLRSEKVKFQLKYLPEPFLGDPNASIVLLSLNPGFAGKGDSLHLTSETFKQKSRQNLLHTKAEYPIYLLDPEFRKSGGHQYWYRKLRSLIEDFSLKCVAEKIFVIEYYGYHSEKCGFGGEMASQGYSFHLVKEAIKRGAIIVVVRHNRKWMQKIPELETYPHKYTLNSPQAGNISRMNCPNGYDSICDLFKEKCS